MKHMMAYDESVRNVLRTATESPEADINFMAKIRYYHGENEAKYLSSRQSFLDLCKAYGVSLRQGQSESQTIEEDLSDSQTFQWLVLGQTTRERFELLSHEAREYVEYFGNSDKPVFGLPG